jgi:hypothetical protein
VAGHVVAFTITLGNLIVSAAITSCGLPCAVFGVCACAPSTEQEVSYGHHVCAG